MDHFFNLRYADQERLRQYMSNDDSVEPPEKKFKPNPELTELEALIKKQNEEFHELRTKIKKNLNLFWQNKILKDNDQAIAGNKHEVSQLIN